MTDPAPAGVIVGVTRGDIAARIDRLPLTRIQYGFAAITQIYWGLIIATDGMPARLYPFLWQPKGMSNFEFSVLLSANIGAGILAGEYLGAFLADRFGRKKVLIAAAVVDAVFLWPIGFTDSFWWLLAWCFLFAIGMGFLLATNAVYLHEIAPPGSRHRIAMRTQMLTSLAAMGPAVASYYWIPGHYRWFLFLLAALQLFILVPLGLLLPESPRWLECHGREEEADRIVSRWEARISARLGPLPAPDTAAHPVVQTEKVPVRQLFAGRYRPRTILLLLVWILGYPGIVYGGLSYMPTYLVAHGWNSHQIFLWGGVGIITLPFVVIGFFAVSLLGERYERKSIILVAGTVYAVAFLLLLVIHSVAGVAVISVVTTAMGTLWLFNMYNYTSAAYPTRLRSVGTGWTDGIGHLGTFLGPLLISTLFTATAAHGYYGWILWVAILCALLPSLLIGRFGIDQKGAVLEQIST
ncbi:MAG TPA: MFS transporter [Trebonia sp.]|jgi:MFS family permease|nr:MFS transporter [Trebonia sp.]